MDMENTGVPAACAGVPSLQHVMCSEHHLNLLLVPEGHLAALSEAHLAAGASLVMAVTPPRPALGVPKQHLWSLRSSPGEAFGLLNSKHAHMG